MEKNMFTIDHADVQDAIELALDMLSVESTGLSADVFPAGWGLTGLRYECWEDSGLPASAPIQEARWEVLADHLLTTFPDDVREVVSSWYGSRIANLAVRLVYPADHARAGQPTDALCMLACWHRDPVTGEPYPAAGDLLDEVREVYVQRRLQRVKFTVAKRAGRLGLRTDRPDDWVDQLLLTLAELDLDGQQYAVADGSGVITTRFTVDPHGHARRHLPIGTWDVCASYLDDDAIRAALVACELLAV
jgi:hypothetical protein